MQPLSSTLAMVMMTHFDGLNRIPQGEAQRPSCLGLVVGSSGLLRILWCGMTDNRQRKGGLQAPALPYAP